MVERFSPKMVHRSTQQLANALGVEVEASSDVLVVAPDGTFKIGYDGSGKMLTFKPEKRK